MKYDNDGPKTLTRVTYILYYYGANVRFSQSPRLFL